MEFSEKEGSPCEIEQSLYFMVVKQASIEDNPNDDTVQTALPKSYMRAYDLVKLDSFVCTHGPSTKVDGKQKTILVKCLIPEFCGIEIKFCYHTACGE